MCSVWQLKKLSKLNIFMAGIMNLGEPTAAVSTEDGVVFTIPEGRLVVRGDNVVLSTADYAIVWSGGTVTRSEPFVTEKWQGDMYIYDPRMGPDEPFAARRGDPRYIAPPPRPFVNPLWWTRFGLDEPSGELFGDLF